MNLDLGCDLLQCLYGLARVTDIENDDSTSTLRCKPLSDGAPNACGATGDQADFAGEARAAERICSRRHWCSQELTSYTRDSRCTSACRRVWSSHGNNLKGAISKSVNLNQ